MSKINKLSIVVVVIIIIGAIICKLKGFNIELDYINRQEINISISQEIDIEKIKEISKSVLNNKKIKIKKIGNFKNAVKIIAEEITVEEKKEIINKINEEYKSEINSDEIEIFKVPNTRIRDIIKPYILPGILTFVLIISYFIFIYNKNGFKEVFITSLCIPIFMEFLYYSIIAITRIPFGRITNSIAIGLYFMSIMYLASYFQKEKTIKNSKKENDE